MMKTFDCVEFQERQGLRIWNETKDMSPDEEVAYWREKAEAFDKVQPKKRITSVVYAKDQAEEANYAR